MKEREKMSTTYDEKEYIESVPGGINRDLSKFRFLKRRNNFKAYKNVKSKLIIGDLSQRAPRLSIVIPTYKRADVLKLAVDSALAQKGYNDYEVVVVDNEGVFEYETETEQLMKSYNEPRLFYYKNEKNIGQAPNWNRCFELARGEWVCFIQNDDIILEDCCRKAMEIIDNDSTIQGLVTRFDMWIHNGDGTGRRGCWNPDGEKEDTIERFLKKISRNKVHTLQPRDYFFGLAAYGPMGNFYKKENVLKLGGIIDGRIACDDVLFNMQYIMMFGMKRLDEVLTLNGQGGNQSGLYSSHCHVMNDFYYFEKELVEKCRLPFGNVLINAKTYEKIKSYNLKKKDIPIPYDKNFLFSKEYKYYRIFTKLYGYMYILRK